MSASRPSASASDASSVVATVPLEEVTLQAALEAAWDGSWKLCDLRARAALSATPDDLETMELMVRCAFARKADADALAWVRARYAGRVDAPIVRYGQAIVLAMRGELPEARRTLEALAVGGGGAPAVPAAAYQAALLAQIDDDAPAAERWATAYAQLVPTDPAGRALAADAICALDFSRCASVMESATARDDDPESLAKRLGAAIATPISPARHVLSALQHEAEDAHQPAWADAFDLAVRMRQGGDPAAFLVRSPRSGRPEPGPKVDLVARARPTARLPFITRLRQQLATGENAANVSYARALDLFPNDLALYRLARRSPPLAALARAQLEGKRALRWRVIAASELARPDELCAMTGDLSWSDRGPYASRIRARCEIASDSVRGRKIAEARLSVTPFGVPEVESAIEALVAQHDGKALETLARTLQKIAPKSTEVASALIATADLLPAKRAFPIYGEVLEQSSYDPAVARRVLRRFVDERDVPRAKLTIAQALAEAPLDGYLCGVEGEILLLENKADAALVWLGKACTSARARRDLDVLMATVNMISRAYPKAKDKTVRDAAFKCAKGE